MIVLTEGDSGQSVHSDLKAHISAKFREILDDNSRTALMARFDEMWAVRAGSAHVGHYSAGP